MISVIIPHYNPDSNAVLRQLLGRAISSALTAFGDNEAIQIIVVDDSSDEPPHDLINNFNDSRITLIESASSKPGAARNRGIAESEGDIIAFLDADDCYFPGVLKQCLEEMRHTDADLLSFNVKICVGNKMPQLHNSSIHFNSPISGKEYMAHHTPFGSCCRFLIKRQLLTGNSLKFMENTYMEDEDFTTRLLFYSRRYVQSDATAYAYYRREGSITTSPTLNDSRATDTVNVLKHLLEFRRSHSSERCDGLDRKIRYIAMDHIRQTLRRSDWQEAMPVQTGILSLIGLWPLRFAAYGIRYQFFALLSRCSIGIRLLHINETRYTK